MSTNMDLKEIEAVFKLMRKYGVQRFGRGSDYITMGPDSREQMPESFEGPAVNEDEMLYWSTPASLSVNEDNLKIRDESDLKTWDGEPKP